MVDFRIDSDAEINVLPKTIYKNFIDVQDWSQPQLHSLSANNICIPIQGKCIDSVNHKHTISLVMFIIADRFSGRFGCWYLWELKQIKRISNININLPAFLGKCQDCFGVWYYSLQRLATYLEHDTKYSIIVWLGTNFNTITWSGTKYVSR